MLCASATTMTPAYGSRARCGLGLFLTCVARSSSRWGDGVTADEMREMQWVKPELVAQIRFLLARRHVRARHDYLRSRSTGAQLIDLPPRVRRQFSLEVVPRRYEVDEDVPVRTDAEVVVEQARRNLERLTCRGGLRHGTAAVRAEKGLIGGR